MKRQILTHSFHQFLTKARYIAAAAILLSIALPVAGNPPPPSAFPVPDVHVIRITDADVHVKSGNLRIMFEILNWTNTDVDQVVLIENDAGTLLPATMGGLPVVAAAYAEFDGRPLDPLLGPADDDGNFPPQDGTSDPPKVGASNTFGATMPSATKIVYASDGPIPARDLLGAADADAACALVPGCVGGVIDDVERIDNALGPDNVLDGFVLEFTDFDEGEVISFNFFLLDSNGALIGYHDGQDFVGNAFGFGTLNIFLGEGGARSHGPPVWTRPNLRGNLRGPVEGNTGTVDPPDNLRDMFVQNDQFQVEVGAAMTAPFRDPTDNDLGVMVNAERHPLVPVELMSFTVE